MKKILKIGAIALTILANTVPSYASIPSSASLPSPSAVLQPSDFLQVPNNPFGGSPRSQDIHFVTTPIISQNTQSHFVQIENRFNQGDRIGTLYIHRLNRTIRVFEGESMRNMDFGAGRFTHSGFNHLNTVLIGHNRGRTNGFFDFVRLLQPGDTISLNLDGHYRKFKVSHEVIVHETDMSLLYHKGDDRLTLVTCVEYRNRYRRIAIAKAIS